MRIEASETRPAGRIIPRPATRPIPRHSTFDADEDRLWFETMVPKGVTAGLRYPEAAMGALDTGR